MVRGSFQTQAPADPRLARGTRDLLGIYLDEAGSHRLYTPEEEKAALGRMIAARHAWALTFLATERGMEEVWKLLCQWRRGEIAALSLVPGPPRPRQASSPSVALLERLHRLFAKHVERRGPRPFGRGNARRRRRLARAVLHVGLRPGPLDQICAAVRRSSGPRVEARIDAARERFLVARRPLIERNLRLVLKAARAFVPGPLPLADLIQEGNMGLLRATESFNGRFGVRFSTYAWLWIRQGILRALENKSRIIRLPVNLTQLLRRTGVPGGDGEVPDLDAASRERLDRVLTNPTVTSGVASLDHQPEGQDSLRDLIPDQKNPSPEDPVIRAELRAFIASSLEVLPHRERLVLRLRHGIGCSHPHTLGEIGELLGLSAERVRQIQAEAFARLRSGVLGPTLEDLWAAS